MQKKNTIVIIRVIMLEKINTIIRIIILLKVILPNTSKINTNYEGVKRYTTKVLN